MEERTQKQLEFLNKANLLSNQPKNRLGPKAKEVLESNNFIFDAHSHIFDGACVDEKYFILRILSELPKNIVNYILTILYPNKNESFDKNLDFNLEDFIYNTKTTKEKHSIDFNTHNFLETFEKYIDEELNHTKKELSEDKSIKGVRDFKIRIKHLIGILKSRKMSSVLDTFHNRYAINNFSKANQISVILGMDLNMGWGYGNPNLNIEKTQRQQNDELLELVKSEAILPFFPVDPRRADLPTQTENLYDNFLAAFSNTNNSFFGVKVYPALGYLPTDPRLDPIFKICSEKNIPILSHCGGTIVSTFSKNIEVNDRGRIYNVPGDTRAEKADYLNHPDRWIPVLEKYPNLHLNIAHFGGAKKWKKNIDSNETINSIIKLIERFDNVYTDFSFNLKNEKAIKKFKKKLDNTPSIQNKCLFGTDFWVVLPSDNLIKSQKNFIKITDQYFEPMTTINVLDFLYL